MADERRIRAKKNIVVSLTYQLITLLCGLIVPRMLLGAFGSELYGATTSIAQFLSYIALLEGGIGGVARAVLYKPLAERDNETISRIMAEIKSFFRVIGCIFAGYVLVIASGFKSISGISCLDWMTSFLLVGAISLSTFGQYFVGISNAVLLHAAQRSYITNFVNILATLLNAVAVCVLVRLDCGIVVVKLVSSMIFILRPVCLWLYVRIHFNLETVPRSKTTYLTQKWNGLGQHIAFYLHSNTAAVILTCFADLYHVAVYSVYNMIVSHIQNLVGSFAAGMEALFGDMLAREEYDDLHKTFGNYEMILSLVAVILFATTLSMILPFVGLYTASITDVDYHVPALAAFLTISSMLYCLRMPYHSLVIAAGHFRQTQAAAYAEAAVNVLLSIVLVRCHGVSGVAFATMLSTALRFVYYVVYLAKHIFYRNPVLFMRRFLVNGIAFAGSIAAGMAIVHAMNIRNYLSWAICACVTVLVIAVITLAVNFLFCRRELLDAAKKYLK